MVPAPRSSRFQLAVLRLFAAIGGATVFGGLVWSFSLTPLWKAVTLTFEIEYEELPRIASPDGDFEIVTIRGNGGATTSYSYEIFVVPKGEPVNRDQGEGHLVFRSLARTRLLDYAWRGRAVEIKVANGPVGFRHSYYGRRVGFDLHKVGPVILTVVE
jgi:hypothetical protein